MYKLFFRMSIALSVALACLLLPPVVSAGDDDSPAAEIRAFWAQLDEQWNARDAAQFSRLFAEDATFGFVDRGTALEGRAGVHDHFAERFPGFPADLRHRTRVNESREITPAFHFVDGTVEVLRVQDDATEPAIFRRFAILAVMMKTGEDWKIRELRVFQLPVDE